MISPHFVRSSLETVPAGQEVQVAVSVCSAIQFTGHFMQIEAVLSRYVPIPHSTEVSDIIDRFYYQKIYAAHKIQL